MRRGAVGVVVAALAASVAAAAAVPIGPWTEAVVSVRDPAGAARLFEEVGQWTVTAAGAIARSELDYWRLPATATGTFLRICAPQSTTGCIRFVHFAGVVQRPIRLAARPWDTGGIFSIMIRSSDAQAVFDQAIALGWWAESEPIAFTFKGSDLRNVVLTGPDGVNVALYQRVSPPFTDYPVGLISKGFNSMRMVRNQRAAVAFYREKLGFTPAFDADYVDPQPLSSNFSLPRNLTTTVVRRAAALSPGTGEIGRVEVMEFVGLDGKDVSSVASPPNLGIVSVRYPVADLGAYAATVQAHGVAPAYAGKAIAVAGLGRVDAFAVRDPDGNLTEFYAPAP